MTGRGKLLMTFSEVDPPAPFIGPRQLPCTIEDHAWSLSVEDGQVSLNCLDACSEERKCGMDTDRHGPMCDVTLEFAEFMHMEGEIKVRPEIITDYTPSTPMGPAEYDAYLVVHPVLPVADAEDQR